ncbi:hypothetical protein U1Q18_025476, partial [Sarracenia purpurea var. burkii]
VRWWFGGALLASGKEEGSSMTMEATGVYIDVKGLGLCWRRTIRETPLTACLCSQRGDVSSMRGKNDAHFSGGWIS